jgi:hypothetical protein
MTAGMTASLVFLALLGGFIVLGWIVSAGAPKRRTRALEALAAEMGFSFVAHLQLPGARLDWGEVNRKAANSMEGTVSGM